ncbi:ABC transporter ATP-binding protein [Paracoccus aurantiacus]|uniref:ABC transporter ATP-binding protein n=1 Tax=Paracoccus aurantiacus TaxID=2599412 RepID=A0A5C6S8E9_9RHOB|nr:ABC transporter ATP-binding protein [Paracoccus aurantiacus]TXB70352.1 ABC transporter ATP-binding protein [Paracoccus aurantiacus]
MTEPLFSLQKARAGYGRLPVFDGLDLDLPAGKVIALCGPNGSGKSTVLRALRKLLPVVEGRILLDQRELAAWPDKELARRLAMLSQSPEAPPEMSVAELAMLGRFAHRKPLAGPSQNDRDACARALSAAGLSHLAQVPLGSLSGGQRQRAWIAMVLAQESGTILLDEPTNHLDIAHAFEVLELVRHLNRAEGRSIVVVLHDLNLVTRYADHVVMFDAGRVAAQGSVAEVLTEQRLADVYGINVCILRPDELDYPVIVPLHTHARRSDRPE